MMPNDVRIFWVLGLGFFGHQAIVRLARQWPKATILAVDCRKRLFDQLPENVEIFQDDAVSWLSARLVRDRHPDFIVPAVPLHLAYEWMQTRLAIEFRLIPVDLPEDGIVQHWPNCKPTMPGQYAVSIADFTCPSDCTAPGNHCLRTGNPRPAEIYKLLAQKRNSGYHSFVIRSFQLAAGVGGFLPSALFSVEKAIRTADGKILLATACQCHGIVNAFTLTARKSLLNKTAPVNLA